MSHLFSMIRAEPTVDSGGEAPDMLSQDDLAMLLVAERRLIAALGPPSEAHQFFLTAVVATATLLRADNAVLCLIDPEDPRRLRIVARTDVPASSQLETLP